MRRFHRIQLPLWVTLLLAVLLSGAITLLALRCQSNALRVIVEIFKAQRKLIVLNAMPVGLLVLMFTCLFRNVGYSAALVNFVVCGFSLANRLKIEVRDEPLFPRDLALLKEAGTIAGTYELRYPVGDIVVVLVFTLLLVLLGLVITCRPFPVKQLRNWLGRLLGAAASLGLLVALILTVYASNDLYNSFRVTNAYYVPSVFNELGFPYCFCHHFTTYTVDKPDGFNKSTAASWETGEVPGQGQPVNVIMVMNEAFSDITDDPAFTYSAESDPLKNLHALQQDRNAISGHLVVPGFAGGTANTEFDVLTGIQTNSLSATTTSSMRAVNRNLDSLFRVFNANGYNTSFFHPGDDWFYNRENVYRWLGAQKTVFADQMTDLEMKGRWVTDAYMFRQIRNEFESTVSEGKNLFHYTTTIQNHMSYTAGKYGEDYEYPAVETSVQLSEAAETLLKVYIEGVRDADAMLGEMRQYFQNRREPVVLVFWGDHLPYLGDNQLAYGELGMDTAKKETDREDILASYKTPYVIWANDAAAQTLNWQQAVSDLGLPPTGDLSACFLGSVVLDLTGRGQEDPWFAFLSQLRQESPVVQKRTYENAEGKYLYARVLEDEHHPLLTTIAKWRQWSYYKLRYQTFAD